MKTIGIFGLFMLSFHMVPAVSANRIACLGTNGERALASNLASGEEHAVASLPALLEGFAKQTNSELSYFVTYDSASTEGRNEYQLIDRKGRYVITLPEASSTKTAL